MGLCSGVELGQAGLQKSDLHGQKHGIFRRVQVERSGFPKKAKLATLQPRSAALHTVEAQNVPIRLHQ